jgi:hypothetical protein
VNDARCRGKTSARGDRAVVQLQPILPKRYVVSVVHEQYEQAPQHPRCLPSTPFLPIQISTLPPPRVAWGAMSMDRLGGREGKCAGTRYMQPTLHLVFATHPFPAIDPFPAHSDLNFAPSPSRVGGYVNGSFGRSRG